ncbi:MAG: SDR family oxidoreductase [Chthoniobacterales bacterium]
MKLEGCHALITGASAGIGRELARQLAGCADTLILVARREERLVQLRDELTTRYPRLQVALHRSDLAKAEEVDELVHWIEGEKFQIDLLVNNAGLGDLGAFATADPEKIDKMMLVNMVALTRLTRALLPAMIAQKRGAILNVSSSASFIPIPNFAVYAATKAYVTSFSEALRGELRGTGVSVSALCPGPVKTEFTEVARREGQAGELPGSNLAHVSVETVATAALHGIEHERAIVIPGAMMKLGMTLVRLTPLSVLRLISRFTAKEA